MKDTKHVPSDLLKKSDVQPIIEGGAYPTTSVTSQSGPFVPSDSVSFTHLTTAQGYPEEESNASASYQSIDTSLASLVHQDGSSAASSSSPLPSPESGPSSPVQPMAMPRLSDHSASVQYMQAEEGLTVTLTGRVAPPWRLMLFYVICIAGFGIPYVLASWFSKRKHYLLTQPALFRDATFIFAETNWHTFDAMPIQYQACAEPTAFFAAFGVTHSTELKTSRIPYFDYRCTRYYFHPLKDRFVSRTTWLEPDVTSRVKETGLSWQQIGQRKVTFGENMITIPSKSVGALLRDEVLHPFNIFQIFSIALWMYDDYYIYASCILLMTLTSSTMTYLETRKNLQKLQAMARFSCSIYVLRNGEWSLIESKDLVPGDIYEVPDGAGIVPCDSFLLSGEVLVDECMLTGESLPISRLGGTMEELASVPRDAAVTDTGKAFLFAGTRLIRAKPAAKDVNEKLVKAVVLRTGFDTTKGGLVKSILYPKPNKFKFYRDSFRFLGIMGAIGKLVLLLQNLHCSSSSSSHLGLSVYTGHLHPHECGTARHLCASARSDHHCHSPGTPGHDADWHRLFSE